MAPDRPTIIDPADVERLSPPVKPVAGAEVGNGLSLTVMVQLLIDNRMVPQLVAEIKNSVGDALGAVNVINEALALVMVTVCGGDCVPCAVEGKISEVGPAVTRGAVALPDKGNS